MEMRGILRHHRALFLIESFTVSPDLNTSTSREYFSSLLKHQGLEPREAQLSMMEAVEKTLESNQIAVMEGGTGVGKTFGYLIPALNKLKESEDKNDGLRIVIATATVTLQEQLFNKDLKMVLKILGLDIQAEIAKGRGRYVCPQRLYSYQAGTQAELSLFNLPDLPKDLDKARVYELQEKLSAGAWSGDRDELRVPVPNNLWGSLIADSATCTNRRCSYFADCPYFKIKKNLAKSKLLITNHDLLLSDIALGSGVLLPEFTNTIYIIDEAHHFPQKALNQFESETEVLGVKLWLRSLENHLSKWAEHVDWTESHVKEVLAEIDRLKEKIDFFHSELELIISINNDLNNSEILLEILPESLREILSKTQESAAKLNHYLVSLHENFVQMQESKSIPDFEKSLVLLVILIKKNYGLLRTLEMLLIPDIEPIAKWVTLNLNTPAKKKDFIIHAAWVTAAELLKQYFWSRVKKSVILCSATLRALGKFDSFLEKVGLIQDPRCQTYYFPSPFAYEDSELFIPWMKHVPEGQQSQAHMEEIKEKLPVLFNKTQGGVLVLFASQWLLQAVFDGLEEDLKLIILCQGQEGRSILLSKHKALIDDKKPSIIFGLQSFSEGVDLPGDYCTHVIIPKLPFAPPTSPIEKTFQRWLKFQNKDPFREHTLPEASLKLTQAVGRLIRRMGDQGVVSILDHRICRKFYGKIMINSLPNFTKNIELQQK